MILTSFFCNAFTLSLVKVKSIVKLCIVALVTLCFVNNLYCQKQIHFSQLTQSFTNCVLKDSDGFIWVGTQDGLLRYDNFSFKVYRYDAQNPYSLPNNYIKSIIEDKYNNLWLGTFGSGLVMWDRSLERFTSYQLQTSAESIHSLELLDDTRLLIGSENGLLEFNIDTKEIIKIPSGLDDEADFINDIYVTEDKDILLGTNAGLLQYATKSKKIEKLINESNLIVYSIEGKNHRIYVGTNKGLYIYNKRKSTFENQLKNEIVSSILLLDNEEWYLGTNSGIAYYNIESNNYTWFTKEDDQQGLKSNLIHVLYDLDGEMIWAGTRKGVHQFSIKPPDFKSLQNIYKNTACSPTTLGMAEDKNNDIWICSRDGLMQLATDQAIDKWVGTCHRTDNTPGMLDSYTINITEDNNNDLWLAYRTNGFSKITENNGKWVWKNFPKAIQQLGGDGVNQVFQDFGGKYWIASRGKGLIHLDPATEKLTFYTDREGLSHPYVFRIYQTKPGFLWISTANGGLCEFDIAASSFDCDQYNPKNPAGLSANMVLSTHIHSDDKLLICTTEGLNLREQNGNYTKINTLDGLPNNVIYAALEDDNGKIWISTNEGISKLDLSQEKTLVTNYNLSHGLASFEFNQHSFLEHSSGLYLFGGVEGVTVFDPIKVESDKILPKIAFTDFQLFNKSVPISNNDEEFSLPISINKIKEINLDYDQNSVALEYAALSITNSENVAYQYKLDGIDPDWIEAGDRNYAPYPNLPHGDYTFHVRLTDLNKNVISPLKSVKINIATPPWKTWWAYLIYTILFFSLLYLITRIQKSRTLAIAKARENERDVFRKKMARDFHDEAGNKITRISLITDTIARKSKNSDLEKTLHKLQDNIQDLRLGMTDFIWVLDPGKDSLSETLRRFMEFTNDTFEYSDINFKMDPVEPHLSEVVMPSNIRRHFLLIMKEAITNIIKHAHPTRVKFTYSNKGPTWTFNILDNGKGFDISELSRINGLNNMKSRAKKIDGTLDIESEVGTGSTISLSVNL